MGMNASSTYPDLVSVEQAFEVGYTEGQSARKMYAVVKPDTLETHRQIFYEAMTDKRGRQIEFYGPWRRTFDAGFWGEPRPRA